MVRFVCKGCGSEIERDIICHGHKVRYRPETEQLVCVDCSDRVLSEKEIEECAPSCCHKLMTPGG